MLEVLEEIAATKHEANAFWSALTASGCYGRIDTA
jgi:hypothetical protein